MSSFRSIDFAKRYHIQTEIDIYLNFNSLCKKTSTIPNS